MSTVVDKGSSLRVESGMEQPKSVSLPFGEVVYFSTASPTHPEVNQDAAVVIHQGELGVLAVSDGAGGTNGAAEASQIVVRTLEESLRAREPEQNARSVVLDSIEKANERIRSRVPGALATVALLVVEQRTARPISVGDSLCLVVGGRGRIKYRSIAHGPTGFAEEAGLLNEREAQAHDERHLVSNMLGLEGMRVEMGVPRNLAPRDTMVVACDALFDNARSGEIARCLTGGRLLDGVASLTRLVRDRMDSGKPPSHPDDLTILACRLPRSPRGAKSQKEKSP
jgi:serine/threonine protein phosphatase PrpC